MRTRSVPRAIVLTLNLGLTLVSGVAWIAEALPISAHAMSGTVVPTPVYRTVFASKLREAVAGSIDAYPVLRALVEAALSHRSERATTASSLLRPCHDRIQKPFALCSPGTFCSSVLYGQVVTTGNLFKLKPF